MEEWKEKTLIEGHISLFQPSNLPIFQDNYALS